MAPSENYIECRKTLKTSYWCHPQPKVCTSPVYKGGKFIFLQGLLKNFSIPEVKYPEMKYIKLKTVNEMTQISPSPVYYSTFFVHTFLTEVLNLLTAISV